MADTTISCRCQACVNACERCPGIFVPGEVTVLAEHMGMSVKELFDKYLMTREYYDSSMIMPLKLGDDQSIFSPSPCIFLTHDKFCSIYQYRPHECRVAYPPGCPEHKKDACHPLPWYVRQWDSPEGRKELAAVKEQE